MPDIIVTKLTRSYDGPLPACLRIGDLVRRIEARAFELFQARSEEPGHELDDWLQAEGEILSHARAVMRQTDTEYEIDFRIPGFQPEEIEVAITPSQVGLDARSRLHGPGANEESQELWREFSERYAYRRVEFPQPVDPESVKVELDAGVLRVRVDKRRVLGPDGATEIK
jgi:HSP20 family molecular chaperone IbpA